MSSREIGSQELGYLFARQGMELFGRFCRSRTLFAFDFDGTLSRIEQRPEMVGMAPKTAALMRALEGLATVAVISGRSCRDLKRVLASSPRFLIGNHGLENSGIRRLGSLRQPARICRQWARALKGPLQELAGVELENKKYSLAVHYRHVQGMTKRVARARILEICANLKPLPRFVPGKSVVNLLPSGGPDKGRALLALMRAEGFSRAIYVGDDDTDEDVFVLPEAHGRTARILGIRVGKKAKTGARLYLRRQTEINRLLLRALEELAG